MMTIYVYIYIYICIYIHIYIYVYIYPLTSFLLFTGVKLHSIRFMDQTVAKQRNSDGSGSLLHCTKQGMIAYQADKRRKTEK
jgi:hypothetical protein